MFQPWQPRAVHLDPKGMAFVVNGIPQAGHDAPSDNIS